MTAVQIVFLMPSAVCRDRRVRRAFGIGRGHQLFTESRQDYLMRPGVSSTVRGGSVDVYDERGAG